MKENEREICLVTGANSGIGKEIAKGLALSGAHVIMVCRDIKKGTTALEEIKTLSGSNAIDLLIADLSSQADLRLLAKTIEERYAKLHVLINNAGLVSYKKTLSVDNIEMTLAVNHLAPFLLTLLLQNLLKKSAPSRVINISSAAHKWAKLDINDLNYEHRKYRFMHAYSQSKLITNMMTFELARKLSGTGVTVNCVHPGAVKTNIGSDPTHNATLKFIDKLIKSVLISPQQAAKPIIDYALSPNWEKISGKYLVKGKEAKSSKISYDQILAEKIWQMSTKLVGVDCTDNL